jgi:hypothetical protein
MKTGEVYFRDEDGVLWVAESFEDESGVVTTETRVVDEAVG